MPISYQFPQPGAFIIGPSFLQIHMDVPQTLPYRILSRFFEKFFWKPVKKSL